MILGIIPARGESKELKRKNIQDLSGKPHSGYYEEFGFIYKQNLNYRNISEKEF